ncbi:MAG: hypothetical protein LBR27_05935 [Bifidobacteriaceae bacterium]|jgi:hypothetical protein|nr:hypothetical protein [Bifidobacteriaceae bacterium]
MNDELIPKGAGPLQLRRAGRLTFQSFVDCNMAEAWVDDRLRIFPGKYGEDPVWGPANDLRYADGATPEEAFATAPGGFRRPTMPPNAPVGEPGLHGAVWFETIYVDPAVERGHRLFALYHNENYPATLPYDPASGEGYRSENWPRGMLGEGSAQAVCRIGLMVSDDGGVSWRDLGIILQDRHPNLVLAPVNTNDTFPGGVGDPSAVASGDYLYVFFGEYGYPEAFSAQTYDRQVEMSCQCISVARLALADLDEPSGKAGRWDGASFAGAPDKPGVPVASLKIPEADGGGPASSGQDSFYWGPSVSWNEYLECWVMMMARSDHSTWIGDSIWVSTNPHRDLGEGANSQDWSAPCLVLRRPGHTMWYPSLQPALDPTQVERYTASSMGRKARLWVKDRPSVLGFDVDRDTEGTYLSDYVVDFVRPGEAQ